MLANKNNHLDNKLKEIITAKIQEKLKEKAAAAALAGPTLTLNK